MQKNLENDKRPLSNDRLHFFFSFSKHSTMVGSKVSSFIVREPQVFLKNHPFGLEFFIRAYF